MVICKLGMVTASPLDAWHVVIYEVGKDERKKEKGITGSTVWIKEKRKGICSKKLLVTFDCSHTKWRYGICFDLPWRMLSGPSIRICNNIYEVEEVYLRALKPAKISWTRHDRQRKGI